MTAKTIAILPAAGIGDALIFMIAAQRSLEAGWEPTLYHPLLHRLQTWFPHLPILAAPSSADWLHSLDSYSLILVENDNSSRISQLIQLYRSKLSIFYPSYKQSKHAPLHDLDHCFDPLLPMADNTALSISKLLRLSTSSKQNGITPPSCLQHRSKPLQVLIHPTSSSPNKNWKLSRFLKLAQQLRHHQFFPLFVTKATEQEERKSIECQGFSLAQTPHLTDLASLIYESGYVIGNDSLAGHLASNLSIPSLIIADDPDRLQLWRPNWSPAELVFPLPILPKKWRQKWWQPLISSRSVFHTFMQLHSRCM